MSNQNLPKLKKFLLDIIFPPYCIGCQKNLEDETRDHPYVCKDCFNTLPLNNALFCPVCFSRIAGKKLCHHSRKSYLTYFGFAAGYENELLKNIIWNYKYNFVRDLSRTLALILLNYLKPIKIASFTSYSLIPVPLHKSRLKWRGFNQAELIAKILSQELHLPLIENAISRIKKTEDQTKLNREQRISNLQNAFQVANHELIAGKNIILIDDIYTTGATIEGAAEVLKQKGAKKIIGLVAAKG